MYVTMLKLVQVGADSSGVTIEYYIVYDYQALSNLR